VIIVALLLLPSVLVGQNKARPDFWQPFKFFVGKWEGAGNGKPGISIENIPAGYRARETYKIIGPDEFVEVFEIAEPGKDSELYSEGHYTRKG